MTHDHSHDKLAPVANADAPKGADPELSVIDLKTIDPRFRPTVVVVAGLPRAGKDSLITAIIEHVKKEAFLHVKHVSSIAGCKDFLFSLDEDIPGITKDFFEEGEPTEAYRSALSEIKQVLDKHFNYTYRMAECVASRYMANDIVIYQVRETDNLNALQYIQNANFLSVHVVRSDRPETPLAPSDKDGLKNYGGFKFDFVVTSRLEDLPAYASLICNKILRINEGTDRGSNLTRRLKKTKAAVETPVEV